jgi:hypothetical protein
MNFFSGTRPSFADIIDQHILTDIAIDGMQEYNISIEFCALLRIVTQ